MFCTTMVGWPGNCLDRYLRQQPRADVVVVADLVADHERELAALVELLRRSAPARRRTDAIDEGRGGDQPIRNADIAALPAYSAARFCTSAAAALS